MTLQDTHTPEDERSDNERSLPPRRRTSSTFGAPGGDGEGCGEEEHEPGELPAHQSRKRSVQREASQCEGDTDDQGGPPARQSQKRSIQRREASQYEGDADSANDEDFHNVRRSPRKSAKQQKTTFVSLIHNQGIKNLCRSTTASTLTILRSYWCRVNKQIQCFSVSKQFSVQASMWPQPTKTQKPRRVRESHL